MSPDKTKTHRLTALDGLRGISSLLVLATHLNLDIPQYSYKIAFLPLRILVRTIMNTGNISVGFFFILCGFLMAYLYERPQSYLEFVQKRYLRIFTVLIVAVVISFSVMNLGAKTFATLLLLLTFIPLIFRLLYTSLLKILGHRLSRFFFITIIGTQVAVATIYYGVVLPMGAQKLFSLPAVIYSTFIFSTNFTLTFIFGDYVPMVDGAYWSLVSEVMFYLAYPLIAWLLIRPLRKLSKFYWVLWYFMSMIVCFGLSLLFKKLLAFDTAHIHFAHFFTVGMIIALAYKEQNGLFFRLVRFFETPIGQVISVLLYTIPVASAFWLGHGQSPYTPYIVTYGLAPFMGLAIISLIAQKNILSRFLRTPLFLFLGAVSFPLYVIHSPILHVLWQVLNMDHAPNSWLIYVISAVSVSLISAYYIHIIVEKFYFVVTQQPHKHSSVKSRPPSISPVKLAAGTLIICLLLIFVAFQQDFSLLSFVKTHTKETLIIQGVSESNMSLLKQSLVHGEFIADRDNLGIVTMKLQHVGPIDKDRRVQEDKQSNTLVFRIRKKGTQAWSHESQYVAWKISAETPFAFGFPEIPDSKDMQYEFELESKGASALDYVIIIDPLNNFRSVYRIPKNIVLKKPQVLATILYNKIFGALSQRNAQLVIGIYMFTLWFVWFIQHKAKKTPRYKDFS